MVIGVSFRPASDHRSPAPDGGAGCWVSRATGPVGPIISLTLAWRVARTWYAVSSQAGCTRALPHPCPPDCHPCTEGPTRRRDRGEWPPRFRRGQTSELTLNPPPQAQSSSRRRPGSVSCRLDVTEPVRRRLTRTLAGPPAFNRADGRRDRPRAAARCRRRCRSASSTARRGRAVPGWRAGHRRGRAGGSRSCGAGRAAWRPAAGRARRADRHPQLDQPRRQDAALDAAEQRLARRELERHERRDRPRPPGAPASISGTSRVLPPLPVTRSVGPSRSARLRPSASEMRRPGAIAEGQHRDIARRDPGAILHLAGRGERRLGFAHGQRLGQRLLGLGRADGVERFGRDDTLAFEEAKEALDGAEAARQRARLDAVLAAPRHEGAEVGRHAARQHRDAHRAAGMRAEEIEELAEVARVGLERFGREAAHAAEVALPDARSGRSISSSARRSADMAREPSPIRLPQHARAARRCRRCAPGCRETAGIEVSAFSIHGACSLPARQQPVDAAGSG